MHRQKAEQVARRMADELVIAGPELQTRLEKALSPDYWTQMYAAFCARSRRDESEGVQETSHAIRSETWSDYRREGYLATQGPVVPAVMLQRMTQCIDAVRHEGWPAVFSYVYDEFWLVSRLPAIEQILVGLLGSGYQQLPHIWTHYVDAGHRAAGWPPHLDGDRRPQRVTVWIPVTDARLENGCMYVVPKSRTPDVVTSQWDKLEFVSREDFIEVLHGVRALPVAAGSVLAWDLDVIHWGSPAREVTSPRVSVSMGFIADGIDPIRDDEHPLIEPSEVPTFRQRLRAIGQALLGYERFEPRVAQFRLLAQELMEVS